jgi:hypothetical protein
VYQICELYIDDVLRLSYIERLHEFNVAGNPAKTKLGLAAVEYVGHVISATGITFTEEKEIGDTAIRSSTYQ